MKPEAEPKKQWTMLVVGERQFNRKLIGAMFKSTECEAIEARTQAEAIATASRGDADLVVVGVAFGTRGGLSLARELRTNPATNTCQYLAQAARRAWKDSSAQTLGYRWCDPGNLFLIRGEHHKEFICRRQDVWPLSTCFNFDRVTGPLLVKAITGKEC
jgi:CheY-like chemotaxis protein